MGAALRSLFVWVAGAVITAAHYFAVLFCTVVFFFFDKQRKIAHTQCFWWSSAILGLNSYWEIDVAGLENIDHGKTYIMVANHQSLTDIIVIYKTRMQFKWVAKESLFKVPFLGWSMALIKYIKLERGQFGSIKKVYREAARWLRKDMSVMFFPEGTRSDTDEMNKFQNGAFKLAIKEKKPVLPISITGTRAALPKGGWVFKNKVKGRLSVLPPIDTAGFKPGDFARLRDMVFAKLEQASS